jgi:hypothetical protein
VKSLGEIGSRFVGLDHWKNGARPYMPIGADAAVGLPATANTRNS